MKRPEQMRDEAARQKERGTALRQRILNALEPHASDINAHGVKITASPSDMIFETGTDRLIRVVYSEGAGPTTHYIMIEPLVSRDGRHKLPMHFYHSDDDLISAIVPKLELALEVVMRRKA